MYNQGYPPPSQPQYPNPQQGYAGYQGYPQWYPPQPQQTQPQQMHADKRASGGRNGRKPQKRGGFKWALLKVLLVLLVLAGLGVGGYVYKTRADVQPYTSVFVDNIWVDGVDVGGMTREQAYAAVTEQAGSGLRSWYVRLKSPAGEYKDITADTLGLSYDPTAALAQAWDLGHDVEGEQQHTVFELKTEIERVRAGGANFSSVQQSANTAPIDTILATLQKAAYIPPQDAAITGFDPDADEPFSFQSEVWGQELSVDAIKQEILGMVKAFQSGEVLIQPTVIEPKVTVAQLQETVALRYRAVTPIDSKSTDARNDNIRNAFSKINGLVLNDGEKFSFNKIVGHRTTANGFFTAFEYSYGELKEGVGGGVCQASTTVYLAAIQSGLTIVDRTSHSTPVSYTEMGKDATVSDTKGREIDFVFKNNSGGKIFFTAHVIKDPSNRKRLMCEVRIYGPSLGNTKYVLEAETVQKLYAPTETEYITDTKHKYTTYAGEEKEVIKASDGYVVDTYLCTLVDGVEMDRKKVSEDTYKNRAARVYVGVD